MIKYCNPWAHWYCFRRIIVDDKKILRCFKDNCQQPVSASDHWGESGDQKISGPSASGAHCLKSNVKEDKVQIENFISKSVVVNSSLKKIQRVHHM